MPQGNSYFSHLTFAVGLTIAAVSAGAAGAFETANSSAPPPTGISGPLSGSVTMIVGHDDNVPLVPDATPFYPAGARVDYPFAGLHLHLHAAHTASETLSYGATLDIGTRWFFGSQNPGFLVSAGEGSDYDRVSVQPRFYLRHTMPLANGRRLDLTPSYSFRFEDGNIEAIGLLSHQLRLDARLTLDGSTRIDGFVLATDDTHDVVFPGLQRRERDGRYTAIGASWRHKFAGGRRAITLGGTIENNDAEGIDWTFEGYSVFAGLEAHLGGRVFGTAELSYNDRKYDGSFSDLIPGGRTEQSVTKLTTGLLYVIDATSAVRLDLTRESYSANDPAFEGDRTLVALSYTRNF